MSKCIVCGSCERTPLFSCKGYFVSGEAFELLRCEACGFVFTHEPPLEEHIAPYYQAASYVSHSNTKKGLLNKLYHLGRDFMLKRKLKQVRNISKRNLGKLLDVG